MREGRGGEGSERGGGGGGGGAYLRDTMVELKQQYTCLSGILKL